MQVASGRMVETTLALRMVAATTKAATIATTLLEPKPKETGKYGPIRYVGISHRYTHHC